MSPYSPDSMVLQDDWSDLRRYREIPEIDFSRLHSYRLERIKSALREAGASMCVLVNPVSLRYAVDYSTYPLSAIDPLCSPSAIIGYMSIAFFMKLHPVSLNIGLIDDI